MPYYKSISLLLLLVITSLPERALSEAQALDEWSTEAKKQHAPENPRNRIIKWCSLDGTKSRWASANLEIKGYEPCGTLQAATTCDAGGNRMIGKTDERPYTHRDCGVGERIVIIRHDPPDTDTGNTLADYAEEALGKPELALSAEESRKLEREIKDAEKELEGSLDYQLQKIGDQLLQQFLSPTGSKKKTKLSQKDQEVLDKFSDPNFWQAAFDGKKPR